MSKLPKVFTVREEQTQSLTVEDLRREQVGSISCEFIKPGESGSPRYKLTFVSVLLIKNEDIQKCFEGAFDKQNIFKPLIMPTSKSYLF
jgi:hypothetical protein